MNNDSTADTRNHAQRVFDIINLFRQKLMDRGLNHDLSKLRPPEKEIFDRFTPLLSGVTFGSKEYRALTSLMRPAIDHHHSVNRHHPEYFAKWECNGCFKVYDDEPDFCRICGYSQFTRRPSVSGMNLVDIVEMLCDWKAASERHEDGNIERSIEICKEKYNIGDQLSEILKNTCSAMGWTE